MTTYVALLRGVNVGGNGILKMAELKVALEGPTFQNVVTYIQSGNVIFDSTETDKTLLAKQMRETIKKTFDLTVDIALFTSHEWRKIIIGAPDWWGLDASWKHNLLVMIEPYDISEIVAAYGELKPEIEAMEPGEGVLYQSLSFDTFSRTTGGKLAANPIYKKMTVRNFNTSQKLLKIVDER